MKYSRSVTAAVVACGASLALASQASAQPIAVPAVPTPTVEVTAEGRNVTFTFSNPGQENLSCMAALQFFGIPISHVSWPPFALVPPGKTGTLTIETPFPGVYRHVTTCMAGDEPLEDPNMLSAHLLNPFVTGDDQNMQMMVDHVEVHH
ncbi:hypothetical protein IEU95_02715 [Hoyosella rhizosphaerae]|uniref:EfeO-type cupredoxin-like domain-containing protein n=1 Tax=Hoyosella rhizosphaerae TaxID=1755582 RepID=A0A916UCH5_9ACTN|nr:hypothetical protein [Hoyosella rhizosphaerae]MBN4925727.1 hypothetical protein [Hoyosella rhizosphaerae]GGC68420.1 hypothetical protein GCM10011410_21450 [Hoyosella rhizosphaerae]